LNRTRFVEHPSGYRVAIIATTSAMPTERN